MSGIKSIREPEFTAEPNEDLIDAIKRCGPGKSGHTEAPKMDPPLIGPDPEWRLLRSGKGHVFYALAASATLAVIMAPRSPRLAAISAGLACGCLADLFAHEYGH
jgi:hypothetical protein